MKRPRKRSRGRFSFSGYRLQPTTGFSRSSGLPPSRSRIERMAAHRDDGAFRRGFLAMVPSRSGSCRSRSPTRLTARGAGLSLVETQALSALVFAGSAQFTAVGLFAAGSAGASIVLTTLLLNIRHLLYGVSVGRQFDLSRRQRPVAAFFLTDEAFGVASGTGERAFPFQPRRRAEPLRHLEPRHLRRLPARVGDS